MTMSHCDELKVTMQPVSHIDKNEGTASCRTENWNERN